MGVSAYFHHELARPAHGDIDPSNPINLLEMRFNELNVVQVGSNMSECRLKVGALPIFNLAHDFTRSTLRSVGARPRAKPAAAITPGSEAPTNQSQHAKRLPYQSVLFAIRGLVTTEVPLPGLLFHLHLGSNTSPCSKIEATCSPAIVTDGPMHTLTHFQPEPLV